MVTKILLPHYIIYSQSTSQRTQMAYFAVCQGQTFPSGHGGPPYHRSHKPLRDALPRPPGTALHVIITTEQTVPHQQSVRLAKNILATPVTLHLRRMPRVTMCMHGRWNGKPGRKARPLAIPFTATAHYVPRNNKHFISFYRTAHALTSVTKIMSVRGWVLRTRPERMESWRDHASPPMVTDGVQPSSSSPMLTSQLLKRAIARRMHTCAKDAHRTRTRTATPHPKA